MRHSIATLLLLAALFSAGCGSLPHFGSVPDRDRRQDGENVFRLEGLTVRAPEGADWKHFETADGQYFVLLRDGLADYVTLYSEMTPLERKLTTIEQLFARLNTNPALEFETLEIDSVDGVQVIRFAEYTPDDGTEYARFRDEWQLPPRPDYPKYYSSKRGLIMLHPSEPDRYITLGCKRNSYHGFIGSQFEDFSEFYFARFIGENLAVAGTEEVAGVPGRFQPPAGFGAPAQVLHRDF